MTDINISKIIIDNDNLIIKDSVARASLNSLSTNIRTDINNLIYNINCNKFSTSTRYDIGDYVIYEGQLYIFNKTHLSGEWNLNEVTSVRLADELKNKVTDAPNDGTSYVRKNNNWAVASSGGGSGSGIGLGDAISFSNDTAVIITGERFIDELSDEFSPAINYQVGDYCIYEGKLYKFTQLHSATTWTTTDVIKVNIANELKSKVSNTEIEVPHKPEFHNFTLPEGKSAYPTGAPNGYYLFPDGKVRVEINLFGLTPNQNNTIITSFSYAPTTANAYINAFLGSDGSSVGASKGVQIQAIYDGNIKVFSTSQYAIGLWLEYYP